MSERHFYNGRTGKQEVHLQRDEAGYWSVWNADEYSSRWQYQGTAAGYANARAEYNRRVELRISGTQ